MRLAKARELGLPLEWIEPPYQWVEGTSVEGERRFLKGPLSGGTFRVTLTDQVLDGQPATKVSCRASVDSGWAVGMLQTFKFRSALQRYLAGIAEVLEGQVADSGVLLEEPAVVQARRLLAVGYHEATSGPRTPVDEAQLETRARRLRAQPVRPELVLKLVAHLRDRPDIRRLQF